MKSVKITNLPMSKTSAEQQVEKLNQKFSGKTYMNLQFVLCPAYGSFDVNVVGQAESEEELKEMVLDLFATALME